VEELTAIAEEAHRLGRHVAAHANGSEGIRNLVQVGIDAVEHCHWRSPEGEDYDPAVVAQMVEQGTFLDKNLHVARARGLPPSELGAWVEEARGALQRHRQMIAAGVRLALCTDAGGPSNGFDTLAWVVALAPALLDIEPIQAIASGTSLPAQVLGLEEEIGTVEPGKLADLILVEGNPLEDPFCLTRPKRVFKDGVEVASQGRLFT
jgi:imidazolonepropionase-like amidohydrolase